jgi:glucose/arabinose dehydrogenase
MAAWLLLACGGDAGSGGGNAPQTVTLTAPTNLADGLAGGITLTALAAASGGIVAVEFQVDGVAVGAEDTSAPYSVDIDTNQWASGQHVLRARGRDGAGTRSAWSAVTVRFSGTRSVPAGFTKDEGWVTGLASATAFAQAPDGRIFIAEQGGNLRVVKNGALLATPFATLSVDSSNERGLLGVAVHPNFSANRYVYVYYTRINGVSRNNRIVRYTATGDVDTSGATVILDLAQLSSAGNHNGGAMKFGIDGKLYVGVGDNGNGTQAQDPTHPFGKMLRLNDDGTPPGDNPFFATQTGFGRYVWATGLRNPYTFAIQPGTGRMHINDVGQETWEEINLGAAGANYGWPASEGPSNIGAGVTGPIYTYGHVDASPVGSGPGGFFVGQAITGGAFYPAGGPFPAPYRGNYFYADFVSRFIAVLDITNGGAYSFGSVAGSPVDMLVGSDGALYVLTRGGVTRISTP